MHHPLEKILGSPEEFLDDLFNQLSDLSIDVSDLEMDHICYRVETMEDYNSLKHQLQELGKILSDKIIGGRPITVIQLNKTYHYRDRSIDIIELPSPKSGSHYYNGYEHVEFVTNSSLENFISTIFYIGFDIKGMKKSINRDVRLQLDGCAVKFHEHSLKYVIEELEE